MVYVDIDADRKAKLDELREMKHKRDKHDQDLKLLLLRNPMGLSLREERYKRALQNAIMSLDDKILRRQEEFDLGSN